MRDDFVEVGRVTFLLPGLESVDCIFFIRQNSMCNMIKVNNTPYTHTAYMMV